MIQDCKPKVVFILCCLLGIFGIIFIQNTSVANDVNGKSVFVIYYCDCE